jgi:hypothetical protein
MPAYNGQSFIAQAIRSILDQTMSDLQLVIVDDASTDATWSIISSFDDPRITAVQNKMNMGISSALNRGLDLCTAELIARHDQDDLSIPMRLSMQVEYLEKHPKVGLLGSWARTFTTEADLRTPSGLTLKHPETDAEIRWFLLWNNPFVHGSVMMRRSVLVSSCGYSTDATITPPEDYELWSRVSKKCEMHNLPTPLLLYRQTPTGMSAKFSEEMRSKATLIALRNICELLGRPTDRIDELAVHSLNGAHFQATSITEYFMVDRRLGELASALRERCGQLSKKSLINAVFRNHRTQVKSLQRRYS